MRGMVDVAGRFWRQDEQLWASAPPRSRAITITRVRVGGGQGGMGRESGSKELKDGVLQRRGAQTWRGC